MSPTHACDSFHPGHNVHPIQFSRAHATPGLPAVLVARAVLTHTNGPAGTIAVVVGFDAEPKETWLLHDHPTTRAALDRWQREGAHLHAHGLLIVGRPDDGVARPCLNPCRNPEAWTPCATIESVGSHDPVTLTPALGGLLLRT